MSMSVNLRSLRINATTDAHRRWALSSTRIVSSDGVVDGYVVVDGERIEAVVPRDSHEATVLLANPDLPVHDVGTSAVLPGAVDLHVHVNEPGRTEWEGIETASHAARAGGVTTIVDMPLNGIPSTTTVEAVVARKEAFLGRSVVDYGFWGGLTPDSASNLRSLAAAGVLGFKAFQCDPGVPEFSAVDAQTLAEASPVLRDLGLPLLIHAELVPDNPPVQDGPPTHYATWLASRPISYELNAVEVVVEEVCKRGAHAHIVHITSADVMEHAQVAWDKLDDSSEPGDLTFETCPHYLNFCAEDIPNSDPRFKCAPPIRERNHRDSLVRALCNGRIDTVGSDHSPAPAGLKHLDDGNIMEAWGGISSLQLLIPATWTACRLSGMTLESLAECIATTPAWVAGLDRRKGAIAPGLDADLVVFDPDAEFEVFASSLQHRHPITPYDGMTLTGSVEAVWIRGRKDQAGIMLRRT